MATFRNKANSLAPGVEVGTLLDGKYLVEGSVGRGGMAQVYAATHVGFGSRVAVKVVLSDGSDEGQTQRVMREARAAASLTSEHVTRVLDVGSLDTGQAYIAMELLDGFDLATVLQRSGPLSVHDAATYLVQACEAVAEAHAQGIIHRDLKPSNLFLTRRSDGTPLIKLMDFGISKWASTETEELTATLDVLGTPQYMAPEQIMSSRDVDSRADVWAMGALLYKLLTGRHPFEGPSPGAVLALIASASPPKLRALRPDAPVKLDRLVRRCLEKDPDKRLPSVRAFARVLLPFADEDTQDRSVHVFDAVDDSEADAEGSPRLFMRSALLITLVVVVATVAGVAVAKYRGRSDPPAAAETINATETAPSPPATTEWSAEAPAVSEAPAAVANPPASASAEAPNTNPANLRLKPQQPHKHPTNPAHPASPALLDPYGDRR